MTFKAIRQALISTLQADADLSALSLTLFGKEVTVLPGMDMSNPPDETQAPLIILAAGGRARDEGTHLIFRELRVICSILGGDVETGLDALEDFAAMVERKTTAFLMASGVPSTQKVDTDDDLIFPWFSACWSYTLTVRDIL